MRSEPQSPTNLPKRLTFFGTRGAYAPDWSPDGKQIAFADGAFAGNADIYVMNADGTDQTRITRTLPRTVTLPSRPTAST
jgi:Tol biopolymer transport system component